MKAEYKMCKACRRKTYRKYDAWNEFTEHWATKGDTLKPPYIRCPEPIIETYNKRLTKEVENYVSRYIIGAYGVKLSFLGEILIELGSTVPAWCPYKNGGWKPEDDMKMVWLNGDHIQDFAQKGKTYEFED